MPRVMPRIGPFTLYAIEAGRFRLDGGSMFGVVPKALWSRHVAADSRNRIQIHARCLLLAGAGRVILIDTGVGHKENAWFNDTFAVDYADHDLERSLKRAGFAPHDVTDVILTHLHFDHAGGSTRRIQGRTAPAFPNATYHLQAGQWETAMNPSVREAASFIQHNFVPLQEAGQLVLVQGARELMPGISVLVMHGHTCAQQLVKVSGPEGVLVFVADLLPFTHHMRAPWVMAYDTQPLLTIAEKERFLREASGQGYHLFFEHDPNTVIANVVQTTRGYQAADIRPLHELF